MKKNEPKKKAVVTASSKSSRRSVAVRRSAMAAATEREKAQVAPEAPQIAKKRGRPRKNPDAPVFAGSDYERHKAIMNERQKAQSLAGRDIGEIPEVANKPRKNRCRNNFRAFCEQYFPETFKLKWSQDHLKCIAKIEAAVLRGGLFALALARGSGKSSLCETACLWSLLYGHREFVLAVGATETAALETLDSIKSELENNDLLADDFPEVCYPIAKLEGIALRCAGQHCQGERTRISWTANEIILPTIKGSLASGGIMRVAGITGRLRGMKYKRADGRSVRPQLVIIDDPQTRESAGSVEQNRKRVRTLSGDILGLAGPGKKIAGIMPCTVIRPGDMADQILDRSRHPEWNGERAKMLYAPPKNMKLWEQYADIRAESYRTNGDLSMATEFYKEHQAEMDEGAEVYWPERFNHDELSAIQHAMNLKLQDPVAFAAEYQNEPLADAPEDNEESTLSADEISAKLNGVPHEVVPMFCTKLTMFVDVQKTLLFYCVIGWDDSFTGAVIDYGTFPKQPFVNFALADASPTLQDVFPRAGLESQIYQGLTRLFDEQMHKEFHREDGAEMRIQGAMIDANWGQSTDIVYQFCRQSDFSGLLYPAHGRYIGAGARPMLEYRKQPGDKLGFNWMIPNTAGQRAIRHVIFDANYWKSFIHARLAVEYGDRGCLSLWGKSPERHELFGSHLTAEYRVKTFGRGRVVDEWKLKPERRDNHWLDCAAGCAVIAAMSGSSLPEQLDVARSRSKVKLSEVLRNGTLVSQRLVTPNIAPVAELPKAPVVSGGGRLKLSELQKQKK